MANSLILRKFAGLGRSMWNLLPPAAYETRSVQNLGHLIHSLARKFGNRNQSTATFFLRNTPLIRVVSEQVKKHFPEGELRFGVMGCSTGAEVYSFQWIFRKVLPGFRIVTTALDISSPSVEAARAGCYRQGTPELRKELPQETLAELFDKDGETLKIKACLSDGIRWLVADARDPNLLNRIGVQDVLLANNFLVHMKPPDAKPLMLALLRLVRPGGLFVCRGVDLDVRESVVLSSGLLPVTDQIDEIHNADPAFDAPKDWPWKYWGLEPLDRSRKNWCARYSAIFRMPESR